MACIPPTLEGWVYIVPTHGPLYTWAQYTPTRTFAASGIMYEQYPSREIRILIKPLNHQNTTLKKET